MRVCPVVVFEGKLSLGVHQINEIADAKIVLKLDLLVKCQNVILILDGKLVHANQVGLIEAE